MGVWCVLGGKWMFGMAWGGKWVLGLFGMASGCFGCLVW